MKENGSLLFPNQISINARIDEKLVDITIENLKALVKVHKKIVVFLDSEGGDLPSAKRLHDYFLKISKDVILVVVGGKNLSSAAILPFQAFSLRLIVPGTTMILHNLKYHLEFDFIPYETSEKETYKMVKKETRDAYLFQDNINQILMKKTGMKETNIIRMLVKKTNLNASQILQYGLADAMYDPALLL